MEISDEPVGEIDSPAEPMEVEPDLAPDQLAMVVHQNGETLGERLTRYDSARQNQRAIVQRGRKVRATNSRLAEVRANRARMTAEAYGLVPGASQFQLTVGADRQAHDERMFAVNDDAIANMEDTDMGPDTAITIYGMREGGKMRRLDPDLVSQAVNTPLPQLDDSDDLFTELVSVLEDYGNDPHHTGTAMVSYHPDPMGGFTDQYQNGAVASGYNVPGINIPAPTPAVNPPTADIPETRARGRHYQPTLTPVTTVEPSAAGTGSSTGLMTVQTYDLAVQPPRHSTFASRMLRAILGNRGLFNFGNRPAANNGHGPIM